MLESTDMIINPDNPMEWQEKWFNDFRVGFEFFIMCYFT